MNREIKFRAWDKKNKKWIGGNQLEYLCVSGGLADRVVVLVIYAPNKSGGYSPISCRQLTNSEVDNLEIVEFTGTKDKKGKEIWEGDILENCEYGEKSSVEFVSGGFWPVDYDNEYGWPESGEIEVIGNIYENPNLLNK